MGSELVRATLRLLGARRESLDELAQLIGRRVSDVGVVLTPEGEPAVTATGAPVTVEDFLRHQLRERWWHRDPKREDMLMSGQDYAAPVMASYEALRGAQARAEQQVAAGLAEFEQQTRGADGKSNATPERRREIEAYHRAEARKVMTATTDEFTRAIDAAERGLAAAIAAAQTLPNELEVIAAGTGTSRTEHLLARIAIRLDEADARHYIQTRDWGQVLARYQASARDESQDRAFVRTFEAEYGFTGRDIDTPRMLATTSAVEARRQARIPKALLEQQATVRRVREESWALRNLAKVS